jgi:hypothetical protein
VAVVTGFSAAVRQPYYQDEHVTLYHGDCLGMDEWLDADVLVTDPPYGMAFVSARTTQRRPIANDHDPSVRDAALDMWSCDRPAALFGTWRVERPSRTGQVLVWDKSDGTGPGMGDLKSAFGTSHEEIYLIGQWLKPAVRRGSVIRTSMAMGSPNGLVVRSGHPTPKPVGLMEILIAAAAEGTVADPFAGSGSTLIAARNQGRKAIGVEIEERYCELIARRLDQQCLDFGEGA